MSVVIFPQGLQIEQKNLNLEVMNEYSKEWNIERFQLKAGKILQADIKATHTPRMQIGFSTYSDAIAIRGDHPRSTILLSLFSENSFSIYQGTQVGDDELIITKDGDEIDFIANKSSSVISLAVEESFFRQKIENYFFKNLDALITNKKIHIHREKSLAFKEFLYQSIVQLQKSTMQQDLPIDYTFVENRILEEFFR